MASPDSNSPPPLPFPQPTHLLTSPSFAVARPTPADLDAMKEVFVEAFARDPGNTYWWSPDTVAQAAWLRMRLERKMGDPDVRYFKVVDHSSAGDRLVAFARWDIPDRAARAFGEPYVFPATGAAAKTTEKGAEPVPGIDYPEGADKKLCVGFFDGLTVMSKKWDAGSMLGKFCSSFFGKGYEMKSLLYGFSVYPLFCLTTLMHPMVSARHTNSNSNEANRPTKTPSPR